MAKSLKSIASSSLDAQLISTLNSREERNIRRKLPEPCTFTLGNTDLIDFNSNDYLSLASSPILRERFLKKLHAAPDILGSGGSRLLVNGKAHSALEARLAKFFGSPAAVLFNSGYDANVGFFSCIPQAGDVLVHDEYIHASVHDGIRASRVRNAAFPFEHNSIPSLRALLTKLLNERPDLRTGQSSLFVAVESLYSMDGTFSPLVEITETIEEFFPQRNGYLIVDEAHATGIFGPQGRGRVAELGLEDKVLARLHTFGKALAASGAIVLTSELIRNYMINYARSLIYTTSLNIASVIAADTSFDMLIDGTSQQHAKSVLAVSRYLVEQLRHRLRTVPIHLLALPAHIQQSTLISPIVPVMTTRPKPLSAYLRTLGMVALPISWPTVPKGKDRIRLCMHAGNTKAEVDRLVEGMLQWAEREKNAEVEEAKDGVIVVQSKL
ncbi:Aminotran-1-2 domain-containing protein [Favolaschia claudopus]|uniref:Aminotran-1-2 domain-containing protein n=1 Tax=Favolaschia claudopus TaxID=2862362 RepID=A0AAW0CJ11_9AGAR